MERATLFRSLYASAVALASALVATGAPAQAPEGGAARVELSIEPCRDVSPAEVRRIAAIELRATAVDAPVHDAGTTRAEVSCEGELARIRVLDPLTGKSLARDIALGRVAAPARSRLLALAVVELVSASWIELEANPTPQAVPVAPPVRAEDRAAATEAVRARAPSAPVVASAPRATPSTWRLTGELGTRWFAVDSAPLFGLGARLGVDPVRTLGIDLDVMAEHGTSSSALGSVALDSVSVGAAMRFRREMGRLTLHGGPGARVGVARITGSPSSTALAVGHEVDGVWAAPLAAVGLQYTTPQHLALGLALEAGYVVLPVRGVVDGGRDVRADGFFSGATVGAGWAF